MPDAGFPTTRRSWRSRLLPLLVLIVGLAITAVAGHFAVRELQRAENVRFERLRERVTAATLERFRRVEEALYGGRSLVENMPTVSHERWLAFVNSMSPFLGQGVIGLGYAERVERSHLAELEARVRADGMPDFKAERKGQNPLAYIVTQIEPAARNAAALGLDMGSGTNRRSAADEAMVADRPMITHRTQIIEGNATASGCLLLLPVYRSGTPLESAEQRTQALRGWVYASLRIDELMQDLTAAVEGQLEVEVYEGTKAEDGTVLYDSDGKLSMTDASWTQANPGELRASISLPLYGKTWVLRERSLPAFEARGNYSLAWVLLGSGALVSLLAAGFTWAVLDARARALAFADQQTASLRQTEVESRRLSLVASYTASSVLLADVDWKIQWVNDSFTRFFGYTPAEVIGHRPSEILPAAETSPATLTAINEALDAGLPFRGEMLSHTKDGQLRWVELDVQPLREKENVITGYMALLLDVTERKRFQAELAQKEAQFRFIFETAPFGVSWRYVQPDGTESRLINEAHLNICQITRAEVEDPGVFARITHPDDMARQRDLYQQLCRGELNTMTMEKRYLRKDGTTVWVLFTTQRRSYPDGAEEFLSTVMDITDHKRAQVELATKEAQFRFIFESVPVGLSWAVLRCGRDPHRQCGTRADHRGFGGAGEDPECV